MQACPTSLSTHYSRSGLEVILTGATTHSLITIFKYLVTMTLRYRQTKNINQMFIISRNFVTELTTVSN